MKEEKFNKSNFEEVFKEISDLNKKDPASHSERLNKLFEEAGEFARAVNKVIGRKQLSEEDTPDKIDMDILEEAADTIQNVISVIEGFGWTSEHLIFQIQQKNREWEKVINKRNKNE
jgi:NTP pyrophosphatase (non-canonical NTP hydrolase)